MITWGLLRSGPFLHPVEEIHFESKILKKAVNYTCFDISNWFSADYTMYSGLKNIINYT
jgi:hypothetical protein